MLDCAALRFHVSRARDERGTYVARKGVIGHDIVFGQVYKKARGVPAQPLPSRRVFGERPWDDEESDADDDPFSNDTASMIAHARIVVVTNVTVFTIPVIGYDGRLTFSPRKVEFNGMRHGQLRRRYVVGRGRVSSIDQFRHLVLQTF